MKSKKGFFIVVEGTDGSGKSTQIKPIVAYLKKIKRPFAVIDFPRYSDNIWGELIRDYLKGKFGALYDVSPYLASLPYALDRLLAKGQIEKWLKQGKIVIADRYTPSNLAFMSARIPKKERADFIKWLQMAEYTVNNIPKEDLVVLLNVTPQISLKNFSKREKKKYLADEKMDIHESNLDYQNEVAKMYLYLAKKEPHWQIVKCMKGNQMKSPEEITEIVLAILKEKKVIS